MRYSEDKTTNESKAKEMGERNHVTLDSLESWLGDNPNDMTELVLDIINRIYAPEDVVRDIRSYDG